MYRFFYRQWIKWTKAMDPGVFIPAAFVILIFLFFGIAYQDETLRQFSLLQDFIATNLGWFYVLLTLSLIILCLMFAFSSLGRVKIGEPQDQPDYSTPAWLAMLFSAGMGTGLIFWSVVEPLTHVTKGIPKLPFQFGSEKSAMLFTYFHWGLHPWAIYSIFALGISYFHFRTKKPLAPRSLLSPLLGGEINGFLGKSFDVICTVGTLFGVATSLGLGAMQINTGLGRMFGWEQSRFIQVSIIALVTLVATISVVSGINKGIKRLSLINVFLATLLTIIVFTLGPTQEIIKNFLSSLGGLITSFPHLSTYVSFGEELKWQKDWTFFYWGWWISWSPFVGIFIARISKGRSVRELILSVLFIPSLVTFLWLSIYGQTAFHLNKAHESFPVDTMMDTPAKSLHLMLEYLPFGEVLGVAFTILIIIFFITSSDSGSLVVDMVTSGGHPNPPKVQRVFWALAEGLVAITLLLAGGLKALQMVSITSGFPMSLLLVFASWGLFLEMKRHSQK